MPPVTAIEFTDLECKVLQVERGKGKRPVLRTLVTFPLPKNEDREARIAERVQLLKDVLKSAKLTPPRVRVIVPKHYVVSRKVTLPSVVDEEIAGMARFEAERHIPFNAERHIVGHHVVSRQSMQGSEVLLAAIDQPVAQEYLDVCLGAGLNVETIDVSTFALHRAFAAAIPPPADGQGGGVSAVINIGLASTEIVITQDGQLAYSRSASVGLGKLLEEAAGEGNGSSSGLNVALLAEIDALAGSDPEQGSALTESPNAPPPPPPAMESGVLDIGTVNGQGPISESSSHLPPLSPPSRSGREGAVSAVATATAEEEGAPLAPLSEPVHLPPPPVPAPEMASEAPPALPDGEAVAAPAPVPPSPPVSHALSNSALQMLFANWQSRLLKEVRTTYEFARREFNCPPITHFHICGEGALIRNLPAHLSKSFGVNATVFDPFSAVEVPPKEEAAFQGRRPAHAALVGGTLPDAPNAVNINLVPTQYTEQKSAKRQQQSYMITGILALTALLLAYVWLNGVIDGQRERLADLQDKNSKMAAAVSELRAKKQRNDIVNTYVRDRKGAVEILDQLSSDTLFGFIPKSVTLRGFEFTKDESVKITGYAMSLADANRMRDALQKTGYFESVKENQGHLEMRPLPRRDNSVRVYAINLEGIFPKPKKSSSASAKPTDDTGDD